MRIVEIVKPEQFLLKSLLDAAITTVLLFPILYVLAFRPLMKLVDALAQTEQMTVAANVELRAQVAEREAAQAALQRYAEKQAALYAVVAAASHQLNADKLTTEATDVIRRLFAADAAWVLFPGTSPGDPPRAAAAQEMPASLVAVECAAPLLECQTCGPWFAGGLPADRSPVVASCPRLPAEVLAAAGFASHVGVMLSAGTRVLGILNLAWRAPHQADDQEQGLLRAIGGQVGIALENATLYLAEQRARETAEVLSAAGLALADTLELDAVLQILLEHLHRLVPYERAKVMLLGSDSRLRVRAIVRQSPAVDFPRDPSGSFDPAANAVLLEVLTTMRPVAIADTHAHPQWGPRMRPEFERSWLGVPLVAGGRSIGLYSLVRTEAGSFSAEQARLAAALAAPASVAIHNAALFEEVRDRRARLQALSRQLVELQENERRRVARELHDEAGQALTSLSVGLRLLERDAGRPSSVLERAAELRRIAEGVQVNLHRLAADLRPAMLDHVGLVPALGQLAETLAGREGPDIRVEAARVDGERLPVELETALYRIAQEAMTNAVRHSRARRVTVVLQRRGRRLAMTVADDGEGFDLEMTPHGGRFGLVGMRERAEMLGGTLSVESSPGGGTTIVVEVPDGG
jgi:signal transduction histidine kinase